MPSSGCSASGSLKGFPGTAGHQRPDRFEGPRLLPHCDKREHYRVRHWEYLVEITSSGRGVSDHHATYVIAEKTPEQDSGRVAASCGRDGEMRYAVCVN